MTVVEKLVLAIMCGCFAGIFILGLLGGSWLSIFMLGLGGWFMIFSFDAERTRNGLDDAP